MDEDVNHDALKGRIERDLDWQDGINAFRRWSTKEIEDIKERQQVLFEKLLTLEEKNEKRSKKRAKSNIHNVRRK